MDNELKWEGKTSKSGNRQLFTTRIMKNKKMIFTAVILVIAIFNYAMISSSDFRPVEFFSVMAIGILTGVFLVQFFIRTKIQRGLKTFKG